ncbi:MAG: hypothetical protein K6A69_06380 [Lachnospiraceae bacterium]|nr:hypothetical protein [Lachnospiraceae bacterium]
MNRMEAAREEAGKTGQDVKSCINRAVKDALILDLWELGIMDTVYFKERNDLWQGQRLYIYYDKSTSIDLRELSENIEAQGRMMDLRLKQTLREESVLEIDADAEGINVPLKIVFVPEDRPGNLIKREKELRTEGKTIEYFALGSEESAVSYAWDILKNLELIREIETYLYLYDMLLTTPLEGRKVMRELSDIMEKTGQKAEEKRIELLKSYGKYSYMKKRWKVLLRREKRAEPSWEECHKTVLSFIEPLYSTIIENGVFFGDWMPDLKRFLD